MPNADTRGSVSRSQTVLPEAFNGSWYSKHFASYFSLLPVSTAMPAILRSSNLGPAASFLCCHPRSCFSCNSCIFTTTFCVFQSNNTKHLSCISGMLITASGGTGIPSSAAGRGRAQGVGSCSFQQPATRCLTQHMPFPLLCTMQGVSCSGEKPCYFHREKAQGTTLCAPGRCPLLLPSAPTSEWPCKKPQVLRAEILSMSEAEPSNGMGVSDCAWPLPTSRASFIHGLKPTRRAGDGSSTAGQPRGRTASSPRRGKRSAHLSFHAHLQFSLSISLQSSCSHMSY